MDRDRVTDDGTCKAIYRRCHSCKEEAEPGSSRCFTCKEKNRALSRSIRADRKERGLCIACGKVQVSTLRCASCNKYNASHVAKYQAKKYLNNKVST